jgi:hypothetical protein
LGVAASHVAILQIFIGEARKTKKRSAPQPTLRIMEIAVTDALRISSNKVLGLKLA